MPIENVFEISYHCICSEPCSFIKTGIASLLAEDCIYKAIWREPFNEQKRAAERRFCELGSEQSGSLGSEQSGNWALNRISVKGAMVKGEP